MQWIGIATAGIVILWTALPLLRTTLTRPLNTVSVAPNVICPRARPACMTINVVSTTSKTSRGTPQVVRVDACGPTAMLPLETPL